MTAEVYRFPRGARIGDPDDERAENAAPAVRPQGSESGLRSLAMAASTGDPQAVGALFDRFQPMVTRYLGRIVGGPDVEDLVQATFLVVARGNSSFDGRSKASTWLLGIATNVARHHRRANSRRQRFVSALSQTVSEVSGVSTERDVVAKRTLQRVERVLAEQPEERRLAFVLCELEGRTAREAAAILATSETAIWKRVSDARRALKQAMEEVR